MWPLTGRRQGPDLTPRVEVLERRIKALEIEWDEWYDKYRRLYARLAKRVERAQNDEPEAPKGGIAPPPLRRAQRGGPTGLRADGARRQRVVSYYRGDYYRGDYYRGDPGLFSFIGKAAKAVGSFVSNPLGTVVGAATSLLSPTAARAQVPMTTALQMPTLQRPLIGIGQSGGGPGTVLQVGGSTTGPQMPGTPPVRGYHWNRSAYYTRAGRVEKGTKLVRNRHTNVGNAHALTHSLRRAHGFARLARHVMSFEITGRKHGRGHFKARRRR